jgi:hypothetical protein
LGVGCVEKEEGIHGLEETYEHAMAVICSLLVGVTKRGSLFQNTPSSWVAFVGSSIE